MLGVANMSKSLLKQYSCLARNIANFSDGQVRISEDAPDSTGDSNDTMKEITLTFSPSSGLYRGGTFNFKIYLNNFPLESPDVICRTPIYHPNIGYDGDICLNLLDELWSRTVTLEDIVQGILFLFYNPNIQDPVSELFDGDETYEDYKRNVRRSLRGNDVVDVSFERNLPEDFQSDVEEDKDDNKGVEKNILWDSEYEEEDIDFCCSGSDVGYSSLDELNSGEKEVRTYPVLLRSYSVKSSCVDKEDLSNSTSNMGQSFSASLVALFIPASLISYIHNQVGNFLISRFSFWLSRTAMENSADVVQR